MRVFFSNHFLRAYQEAPPEIKREFDKQLKLLLKDISHPSLRAKIIDSGRGIWQSRVGGNWRFYFQIREDACYLLAIIAHPK